MIPSFISLEVAKQHLHITHDDLDLDIDMKIMLASKIVANHCKLTSIPDEWIETGLDDFDSPDLVLLEGVTASPPESPPNPVYARIPGEIQGATMLVLGDLFENRESSSSNVLSDTVIDLLRPFRDPTQA